MLVTNRSEIVVHSANKHLTTSILDRIFEIDGIRFEFTENKSGDFETCQVIVENISNIPKSLTFIDISLEFAPRRALVSGYQSWSPVTPVDLDTFEVEREKAPAMYRRSYHYDADLASRCYCSDDYIFFVDSSGNKHLLGTLDIEFAFVTFYKSGGRLFTRILLDDYVFDPGEKKRISNLLHYCGDEIRAFEIYYSEVGKLNHLEFQEISKLGWSSWYQYFGGINERVIKNNLELAKPLGIEVFQIDDGYQQSIGSWLKTNQKFPSGFSDLVKAINKEGLIAGIWLAPFLLSEGHGASDASLIARDDEGQLVKAAWNPIDWGGYAYAKDFTVSANWDYMLDTFHKLKLLGFRYFKIDFCYAALLGSIQAKQTRLMLYRSLLRKIRETIGEEVFLLGCGAPLIASTGLVDAMRVSPDTAPYFEWRAAPFGYGLASPSLKNAMLASIYRSPMHRRLFICDPDCLMLRSSSDLTKAEIEMQLASNLMTGSFGIISDDLSLYDSTSLKLLKLYQSIRPQTDRRYSVSNILTHEPTVSLESFKLISNFENEMERPVNVIAGGSSKGCSIWLTG